MPKKTIYFIQKEDPIDLVFNKMTNLLYGLLENKEFIDVAKSKLYVAAKMNGDDVFYLKFSHKKEEELSNWK